MSADAGADPLALIIAAGGACISALALLVWSLVLARLTRVEKDVKEVASNLIGNEGTTVKIARLEGRVSTHEAEIGALKTHTLSRELFDRATKEQNEKLDDLRDQTREIERKVERLPRTYSPYPPHGSDPAPKPPGRSGR